MGFEVDIDRELGLIMIKQFANCTCCYGSVNMCSGMQCESLGMCFCIYSHIQDQQYVAEMRSREALAKK